MWLSCLSSISIMLMVLISVAFFSLFERKLLGVVQYRLGPNKVSVGGFLQPMSDGLKFLSKNESAPLFSMKLLYLVPPFISLFLSLCFWMLYPLWWNLFSSKSSGAILLILFSISVYGVMMAGWFSSSKYAEIGCVRALAQSVSYEVGLTLSIIVVFIIMNSLSLEGIYMSDNVFLFFPLFTFLFFFFVSFLAELNRSPFDLAEGESELVCGFCVEYGGLSYTSIFLSENISLLFSSMFLSMIFFKNSILPFLFFVVMFVIIRSAQPRLRFDMVMKMFWLVLLPFQLLASIIFVIFS